MDLSERWLWRMIQGSMIDNTTVERNKSIDVLCANCISPYDPIACVRSGIISLMGIATASLVFVQIVHLHATTCSHIRLTLFFILCVHCIAASFEWLLGWRTVLLLFVSYAKVIELLVVCYFYLNVASRMMHWNSNVGKRLCFSALFLMFTYFTMFLVIGFLLSFEPTKDCHAPYWIWFSTGEFVMVQLMVGSFLIVFRRMRGSITASIIRSRQRRSLLSLFWTFETSALADLTYHVVLFLLTDDTKGCSDIFDHNQLRYSLLKLPYDIVSFLMPAWAIVFVFRPSLKSILRDDDCRELFHSSRASLLASVADVVVVRNWQRRYRPSTQLSQRGRPIILGRRARTPRRLRMINSTSPMLVGRLISLPRNLVSSPLYSIPEEIMNNEHHDTIEDVGSID